MNDFIKIKKYDFERQEYFSISDFKKIKKIFKGFEECLSINLKRKFKKLISFTSLEFDQFELQEFIISLPNPTALSVFKIEPLQNKGIIEIDLNFLKYLTEDRNEFTEVSEVILDTLQDIIQNFFKIQFKSTYFSHDEIDSREISIVEPTEVCLLISLKFFIDTEEQAINIILPYFDFFYFFLPLLKLENENLEYTKLETKNLDLKDKLLVLLDIPKIITNSSLKISPNAEFIWRNFIQEEQVKIFLNNRFIGTGTPLILENESKAIRIDRLESNTKFKNDMNLSYLNEDFFLVFGETNINPSEEIKISTIYELNQKFWEPPMLIQNLNKYFYLKIIQCNNNSYVRILPDENKGFCDLIKLK